MRAVVLNQHGGLENLKYVTDFPDPRDQDVPLDHPGIGEVGHILQVF